MPSQSNTLTLVVILTVRKDALAPFREFEHLAARVMNKHGGSIERAVVIPSTDSEDVFKEVHIVSFPHEKAFQEYQKDEALHKAAALREQAVVKTEVWRGEEGPDYGKGA